MFDFSCFKHIMGGTSSSPRKHGCWKFRKHIEDENGLNQKKKHVKRPNKLSKLRLNSTNSQGTAAQCGEIPTPSVLEHQWSEGELSPQPPSQEKLMQIISCFPFPTPRNSTTTTPAAVESVPEPTTTTTESGCCVFDENAFSNAFGKLVQHLVFIASNPQMGFMAELTDQAQLRKLLELLMHMTTAAMPTARPRAPFDLLRRRQNLGKRSFSCCEVSVETMAITALPMDVWLRERLKKWVQLSGHEGSIVPASCQTLYKKQPSGSCEAKAYEAIMRDPVLEGLTPKYLREIQKNEECFIEIEDLLQQFTDPTKTSIMDIKVGCRTFLESEVSNCKRRADLYQKMIAIDPNEPTDEEHERGEITKLRYMQFRERESSSAQLGFRIEAAKMPGGCLQKNFKKVRSSGDVTKALIDFFGCDRTRVKASLLQRLRNIRHAIEKSEFFRSHEVVGSSLLIVHDAEKVGCWMIDFAKSHKVTDRDMDHRSPWIVGNHEDGYLTGIDNLIEILEDVPPMGVFPDEEIPR